MPTTLQSPRPTSTQAGRVTQIIGSTFDAEFPEDHLPPIYNAVKIDGRAEGHQAQSDRRGPAASRRRAGALRRPGQHRRHGPRHGLRRYRRPGQRAGRQGHARPRLQPPGRADRRPRARSRPRSYWPIHRDAPRVDRSLDQDRDLRDGHQGHRPADALRPRRQGRAVRRGRPGQDRHPHRADRPHRLAPTAAIPSSPASASGPARATTSGWKCSRPRSATPAAASSTRRAWSSAR